MSKAQAKLDQAYREGKQAPSAPKARTTTQDKPETIVKSIESIHEVPSTDDEALQTSVASVLKRVNSTQDINRMVAGVGLVNLFNDTILFQGGRGRWSTQDYRAFIIALEALNTIEEDSEEDKNSGYSRHSRQTEPGGEDRLEANGYDLRGKRHTFSYAFKDSGIYYDSHGIAVGKDDESGRSVAFAPDSDAARLQQDIEGVLRSRN